MVQQTAKRPTASVSEEFVDTVALMAQPAAGVAALSALGLGIASHAFGLWLGLLTAGAEASGRLFLSALEGGEGGLSNADSARRTAATRAKTTAKILMFEAQLAAGENSTAPGGKAETRPAARRKISAEPPRQTKPAELSAEGLRQPKAIEKPAAPDDLKKISGIGPKLEAVLNKLGVWTYAQIAEWGRDEIAWLDDHLTLMGRIGRDDWVGQAVALAKGAKGTS
jgi:NADH-quinone oxidoreductase subunit E